MTAAEGRYPPLPCCGHCNHRPEAKDQHATACRACRDGLPTLVERAARMSDDASSQPAQVTR